MAIIVGRIIEPQTETNSSTCDQHKMLKYTKKMANQDILTYTTLDQKVLGVSCNPYIRGQHLFDNFGHSRWKRKNKQNINLIALNKDMEMRNYGLQNKNTCYPKHRSIGQNAITSNKKWRFESQEQTKTKTNFSNCTSI